MNCSRNDVVLLLIPFTDLSSRKVRPAIVVGQNGADIFVVPISSVLSNTHFAFFRFNFQPFPNGDFDVQMTDAETKA